jgi:uncharacterized membrane protein
VVIVAMLYPLAVYVTQGRVEPRVLAAVLGGAVAARLAFGARGAARWWSLAVLALTGVVVLRNDAMPLKLYPVMVNAGLLLVFGWSLYQPPTVIERVVRRRTPELPPEAVAYITKVTALWCAFFLVNGILALLTARYASTAVWSLYNGLIAYVLMGLLFGGEYLVRRRVMRRVHG